MDERGCVAGGRDSFDPTDFRLGDAQALVSLLYAHVLAVRDIQSLSVTLFSTHSFLLHFGALFNAVYSRGRWPTTITPYTRLLLSAADRHSRPTTTTCTTRKSLSRLVAFDSPLQRTPTIGVLPTTCMFVVGHHSGAWLTTAFKQVRLILG